MPLDRAKKNVAVLATCQALFNSTFTIHIALGGLIGHMLATNKAFATVPVTAAIIGVALTTIPASLLMQRVGRRNGFMVGGALGLLGSAIGCYAIWYGDFWLYAFGGALFGAYSAFAQYYRFAAADMAADNFKSKAISLVLAGGVVAGFVGPEVAKHTKDMFAPVMFFGTYLAAGLLCLAAVAMQLFIDIPKPAAGGPGGDRRPLGEIMRQPVFVVAAMSGAFGFGVMSLLMTATPLAMVACAHPFDSAATVIQFHVIAMFAPSFVTGWLINRFGVLNIICVGAVCNLICIAIALSGVEFLHFWGALVLLGLGWNFMFIGGTTLLTQAYSPAERASTQAANDFLVFGTTAVASLSSGTLLHQFGWTTVIWTGLPFVVLAGAAALWLRIARQRWQPA